MDRCLYPSVADRAWNGVAWGDMAGTPPSTRQTPRPSLDVQFNAALLDFAPRYMRDQLEQLAHECDQRLEHELLPRLHAALHEIDRERDAFEGQKRQAACQLRDHLVLLRFDAASIDNAVDQLQAVTPQSFSLLPEAMFSELKLSTSTHASLSTPSGVTSLDATFDTVDAHTDSQDAFTSLPTPGIPGHHVPKSIPQTEPQESSAQQPSLDNQLQAKLLADSSVVSCTLKRPTLDAQYEAAISTKRHRAGNETVRLSLCCYKVYEADDS